MNIVLIGPQGSGKGTISELITKDFRIPHISTGDIFRSAVKNKTPFGLEIKKYMDSASLVPDELTVRIVKDRLSQKDCENGFILDGFPRTLNQAKELAKLKDLTIDYVIELNVPDEVSIKRISSRVSCSKCNSVYGIGKPPKENGVCDLCNGNLFQRDDDKPEFIKKRLAEYHSQTEDALRFYEKKGLLHKVDATGSVEQVYSSIKKILV